ncbi:CpsD/CapB family tyrosine-protein kinase [Acetobacterium paludosum]|nr:CpsD/CapB family tyrosine-protein kinase [Acetobacterium paludosum]
MNDLNLVTLSSPTSFATESYKLLRTNLNFKNVKNKYQVMLLTSAGRQEGKTTTICNLAVTLAQSDKRVLLIDADLRLPHVNMIFGINKRQTGLSNMLVDDLPLDAVATKVKDLEKLEILTAGNKQVSPTELLNSEAFESMILACKQEYDIILIDTPPVLIFADASIISKMADGVILVVAAQETKKEMAVEAKKALDKVGAVIIGVVLTKVKFKKKANYYRYDKYSEDKVKSK